MGFGVTIGLEQRMQPYPEAKQAYRLHLASARILIWSGFASLVEIMEGGSPPQPPQITHFFYETSKIREARHGAPQRQNLYFEVLEMEPLQVAENKSVKI